jgi:hypothetical protein
MNGMELRGESTNQSTSEAGGGAIFDVELELREWLNPTCCKRRTARASSVELSALTPEPRLLGVTSSCKSLPANITTHAPPRVTTAPYILPTRYIYEYCELGRMSPTPCPSRPCALLCCFDRCLQHLPPPLRTPHGLPLLALHMGHRPTLRFKHPLLPCRSSHPWPPPDGRVDGPAEVKGS